MALRPSGLRVRSVAPVVIFALLLGSGLAPAGGSFRTRSPTPARTLEGPLSAPRSPALRAAGPVTAAPPPSAGPSNLTLSGTQVLNVTHSLAIDDLTVTGSAQFIFGNSSWTATLTIYGNVYLAGSASVKWWDGYYVLEQTYAQERQVDLYGSSKLLLNEALVSSEGLSWDGDAYDTANVTILSSRIAAHSVFQFYDNTSAYIVNSAISADLQPFGDSRLTQESSADSALWFQFTDGVAGTFSFPAPNVETNWSFPPSGARGLGYRVRLIADWPALFAVLAESGSNVTVSNTTGLDATVLPTSGTMVGSGFRYGENPAFTFASDGIRLRLLNVSVDAWAFYPVDSTLELTNSTLGEVNGWNSTMVLTDSNLTDTGGYYAAFENSTLEIANCTIGSTVEIYDTSRGQLANSTTLANESLLAVNNGTLEAVNVTLGPGASYAAQQAAQVEVLSALRVQVTEEGVPVAGATVEGIRSGGLPWAAGARSDASGLVPFYVESETLTNAGAALGGPVTLTAESGDSAAENVSTVAGPTTWDARLAPILATTIPANATAQVPANTTVRISFAFAMNESLTASAISTEPEVPVTALGWSLDGTTYAFAPNAGWPAGTSVEVTIGTGATTALGLGLASALTFSFSTAAGTGIEAVPSVTGSSPGNNSSGVGLFTGIALAFSLPMDPAATAAAFSVSPQLPPGSVSVNGSVLLWTGEAPLRPGTTYSVSLASSATAIDGAPLAAPFLFRFTTIAPALVPTLLSSTPADDARLASAPATVVVTFTLPMDPNSTAAAFTFAPTEPGSVTVTGATLTFAPSAPLPGNTTYTLSIGPAARSALGVPLLGGIQINFTVAAPTPLGGSTPATAPAHPFDTPILLGGAAVVAAATFAGGVLIGRRLRRPEA